MGKESTLCALERGDEKRKNIMQNNIPPLSKLNHVFSRATYKSRRATGKQFFFIKFIESVDFSVLATRQAVDDEKKTPPSERFIYFVQVAMAEKKPLTKSKRDGMLHDGHLVL